MFLEKFKSLYCFQKNCRTHTPATSDNEPHIPTTPMYTDGGYGWVVVASCFVVSGLTSSIIKAFGVFFLDVQEHFDEASSNVAWVTSIVAAVFHLFAPVTSALSIPFTHRVIIMIGGLLSMLGMLLGSFGISLIWMYATTGLLLGIGVSFSWIPAVSMVSQYFTERRPLANAIASSGECVFTFLFSPLVKWLVEEMSWQGAMAIIGAIQLNLCVCGALMRPYQPRRRKASSKLSPDTSKVDIYNLATAEKLPLVDLSLFKLPEFVFFTLYGLFNVIGYFIPSIYLVPHALSNGVEDYRAAFLLSFGSVADLVGRIGCGWFANLGLLKNMRLLTIVTTLLGVNLMLFSIATSYWLLTIFSCLFGFFYGASVSLLITVFIDVVGISKLDNALGLSLFFRSIGCLLGPPLAGALVDITEEYSNGFHVAGLAVLISAVFLVMTDYVMSRAEKKSPLTKEEELAQTEMCISVGAVQGEKMTDKLNVAEVNERSAADAGLCRS
nr:PREDICTED: monocarboxylate transporter 7-like isoform X2 [Latimeria chalumnae]|eukprot:XP_014349689.1 PREDICTED: monocarboxylate transporter 7-like isoform X2 [Latimeria chalumnae]